MSESTKFDLSTSEGGRGWLENLFQTQLKRHDFTNYIRVELAADFACALSQYIAPALASVAALQAENEALLKGLTGKHALNGATYAHLIEERDALRRHLHEATTSLETISKQAGRDEYMKHMSQVCGYANSRATVARAFMDQPGPVIADPAWPWTAVADGKHEDGIRYIGATADFIVGDVYHGTARLVLGRISEEGYVQAQKLVCWRYSQSGAPVEAHLIPTYWQPQPATPKTKKPFTPLVFSDSPDGAAAEAVYLRQVAAEDKFNGR